MKNKPDDRSDNVEKIQKNINNTIENMEIAEDMIANLYDDKAKNDLRAKNDRRRQAIAGMRREVKDEAEWQENNK